MPNILKVNKPSDYLTHVGTESRHPLIGVVDFDKISPIPDNLNHYELYELFMHRNIPDNLTYGCGTYE